MSKQRVIGVFEVLPIMDYYSPGCMVNNPDLRWLLENLSSRADKEMGMNHVDVGVKASSTGLVYDILLNNKSVGYFALRNFVMTLKELKLPNLIAHGPEQSIDLETLYEEHNYSIYCIPLFGEVFDDERR